MHGLLAGGGAAFERLLPGFKQQCISSGAKYVPDKNVQVGKQISMVSREWEMPCRPAVAAGPIVDACACNIIVHVIGKVSEQTPLIKQMLRSHQPVAIQCLFLSLRSGRSPLGFVVQSFGRERMTEMPCPKGYNLLLATRVLFERCARATLLEQNQNVRFCPSQKVENLLYDEAARSVQGRLYNSTSASISC